MGGGLGRSGLGRQIKKRRGADFIYGGPERGINPLLEGENM